MSKQQSSWKSPNDEMPPEGEHVLACLNHPVFGGMNFQLVEFKNGRWYHSNGYTFVEVSMLPDYWMSIPPLPAEGKSTGS